MLAGRGFEDVYNLTGGIKAWEGAVAVGPAEVGMGLITGRESPPETLLIAYTMEDGLRSFYQQMGRECIDPEATRLFERLASMDVHHKQMIFELYKKLQGDVESTDDLENRVLPEIMEGGMTTEEFLAANQPSLDSVGDVLVLAMMLETQALDLYLRYAHRSEDPKTKEVLHKLADEEKGHLATLGNLREKY
jgi:rubrerythrin